MLSSQDMTTNGWLAFELGVLRRLKFNSVAIPFAGEPELGLYLKRWDVRVTVAAMTEWAWTKAAAYIENNSERLSDEDVEMLLEDAYMPRLMLSNPSLARRFNEMDAWWFDNLRGNAEQLASQATRAEALSLGMMVGDYVLSFDEETRTLRQPLSLSEVFRRARRSQPALVNNSLRNTCALQEAREFVASQHTDLLFLRLPGPGQPHRQRGNSILAWREEWLRGGDDFWDEYERQRAGRLGSYVETKQQYLSLIEEILHTAAHLPNWAIAFNEDGFMQTEEFADAIGRVRKVESIYTKDFSELTGARAVVITA